MYPSRSRRVEAAGGAGVSFGCVDMRPSITRPLPGVVSKGTPVLYDYYVGARIRFAADLETVTDGSAVTNLATGDTWEGVYGAGIPVADVDGKPAWDNRGAFAGHYTADPLAIADAFRAGDAGCTIVALCATSSEATQQWVFDAGPGGDGYVLGPGLRVQRYTANGHKATTYQPTPNFNGSTPYYVESINQLSYPVEAPAIMSAVFDAASRALSLYHGGTLLASALCVAPVTGFLTPASYGINAANPPTFGCQSKAYNRSTRYFNGYVRELLYFPTAKDAQQIADIADQMSARWGAL